MEDDLEARLQSHARAFEGLLSLIPAKDYYGKEDSNSFDTLHHKQTQEERRAARRAKLDPASHKTAKDVMDENARKRKRELEGDASSDAETTSDLDLNIEKEKPLEGLRVASKKSKKQKVQNESHADEGIEKQPSETKYDTTDAREKAKAEKKKLKADKKKEKLSKKQEKAEKKALQQEFGSGLGNPDDVDGDGNDFIDDDSIQGLDVEGLAEEPQTSVVTTATNSHASSSSVASAASSSSSIVPPTEPLEKKEKPSKLNPEEREAFKARLTAKLEAMRAARKADGPDGRPARNRAELIETRRKKEAERKAARKASRQLLKEDEQRLQAEDQLARIRGGSGSPMFPLRSTPEKEPNLSFGRVAWKDGQQLDSGLSGFLDSKSRKGKSDIKTALLAAEKKKARINALDETKRKDIEEKDMWLDAKKRVQGEKVHNDASLLKKSVKRQEKVKAKSKQEWKERLINVEKGKAFKQKKREENLKKRKEEKGGKGKGKGKKVSKPGKKVRRPGFEGTFKAR